MAYIISIIIGYIIGSLPTAYLLLKRTHGVDITKNGSGNVGAMNSFEITNSKWIGLLVFFIDAFKGWLSCFLTSHLVSTDFIFPMLALLTSVVSHCYSPWIKFKGGRGLATAAGGGLFISIPVLVVWGLTWLIIYLIKKNIHLGNIIATIVTGISAFVIDGIMMKFSFIVPENSFVFSVSVSSLMLVIFSKHIIPLMDYIKNLKTNEV